MWDLVGIPEDRFSHNEAHFIPCYLGALRVKCIIFSACAAASGKRKSGKGRSHAPKPQMFEDTSVQPQPPQQYGYGPPQAGYGPPQAAYGYGMQGIVNYTPRNPPQTLFVGGYTVFTSVRPNEQTNERTNESVSVTFCFLNILKSRRWNFIKLCKNLHMYKANNTYKKLRARG